MDKRAEIFNVILDSFENAKYKAFMIRALDTYPDYFWEVGASSTGKYHPDYCNGVMGLARHTCALARIMNYVLGLDCFKNLFTSEERDCLRVAALMHDSRKSGNDDDFKKSKYTRFDHPIMAANVVRRLRGNELGDEAIEFIADMIESHSGQWNTDSKTGQRLPLPENTGQMIVHMCDYLASRKDISLDFSGKSEIILPDINEYKLTFGKYKGKTIPEIAEEDSGYLDYLRFNVYSEPVKSLLKKYDETSDSDKGFDDFYAKLKEAHKNFFSDISFTKFYSSLAKFVADDGFNIAMCSNEELLKYLGDFVSANTTKKSSSFS